MEASRVIVVAIAVALVWSPTLVMGQSEDGADYWRISREKAECIIQNLDAYLARPGAIALISVDACPDVDPFAGALKGLQNQSGLMAEVNTGKASEKTAKFVSYPKTQLKCLKNITVQLDSDGLALLPKSVNCE